MHHVLKIQAPIPPCLSDGIGRHARLKIWCPYGCVGSSPTSGTIKNSLTSCEIFLYRKILDDIRVDNRSMCLKIDFISRPEYFTYMIDTIGYKKCSQYIDRIM